MRFISDKSPVINVRIIIAKKIVCLNISQRTVLLVRNSQKMALITDYWLLDLFALLTTTITIFLSWVKWSQTYWSRKGLSTPPVNFFFGHSKSSFAQQESAGDFAKRMYEYFKKQNKPHGGFYVLFMSMYIPLDLEIIKSIMQTDFNHFVDRGIYFNEENDPLSAHLFSLEGTKWRNLRVKLTPTFTSGKMKMMFETLVKCGDQLTTEMDKKVGDPIDIKDILTRFTTDIIGNCAFGIDCNSLKDPNNEFSQKLKLFFVEDFWQNFIGLISFVAPDLIRIFGVKVVNPVLSKFFLNLVRDTTEYREKNNIFRKDFMHLLLQLKNRGELVDDDSVLKNEQDGKENEVAITENEMAAQAFVFFLAGYETSSTAMTFCLFELASNPDLQEKVREEVKEVLKRHDNHLTYDAIMEMHYMEKVVNETLRKYPPLPFLNRVCTKDYRVPGTDLVLEKGTKIVIPIVAIQHDPKYYPDPEKFDPERFSEDNKRERHPYAFLPFGEGPRVCIGLRFGMMQTKVGLSVLLKNYRFSVNPKTSLPLKLDPRSFTLTTVGGIWLDYTTV